MMSKEIRILVDLMGSLLDISRIYSRKIPIQRRRVLIKRTVRTLSITRYERDLEEQKIGPFLLLGALVALFYGDFLISTYVNIFEP